ncbi:MAG: hypothetical protein WAW59_06290 [Patescibacteria group bacterium]
MNTVTTPIQPRSPEEIQRDIVDLQRALRDKEQIAARLQVVQAELAHAMAFEEQKKKKVTDLHKLVRRWYLRIVLGEDWSGIEQIMNDTVTKRLAER